MSEGLKVARINDEPSRLVVQSEQDENATNISKITLAHKRTSMPNELNQHVKQEITKFITSRSIWSKLDSPEKFLICEFGSFNLLAPKVQRMLLTQATRIVAQQRFNSNKRGRR